MNGAAGTPPAGSSLPFPPLVVGIAGASGSGKTTFAVELARQLDGTYFPMDNYYQDLSDLPQSERITRNFDDPAIIEISLLRAHVAALSRGEAIARPIYDFTTYTRISDRTEVIRPGAVVLVEGLFALYYPELLSVYHFRLFLDTPDDVCFERRMKRDTVDRGRSADSVRLQYEANVRPSSFAYVRPCAATADLVIDGTGALDWKVEQALAAIRARGLLTPTPRSG